MPSSTDSANTYVKGCLTNTLSAIGLSNQANAVKEGLLTDVEPKIPLSKQCKWYVCRAATQ